MIILLGRMKDETEQKERKLAKRMDRMRLVSGSVSRILDQGRPRPNAEAFESFSWVPFVEHGRIHAIVAVCVCPCGFVLLDRRAEDDTRHHSTERKQDGARPLQTTV